jgi:hypothetical protein
LRSAADENAVALRGYVDQVGSRSISGWAQNPDHPDAPVCLDVYAGGRLIGQTLANRYRDDLQQAGLGSGRHGFEFTPPAGLTFAPDAVEVRRSFDGAALSASDVVRTNLAAVKRGPVRRSHKTARVRAGAPSTPSPDTSIAGILGWRAGLSRGRPSSA